MLLFAYNKINNTTEYTVIRFLAKNIHCFWLSDI